MTKQKDNSLTTSEKPVTPVTSLSKVDHALKASLDYMEQEAGGRHEFIRALAGSQNPAAKALIKALGKVENDDKSVFEICLAIKKNPLELQKAFSEGHQIQQAVESVNKLFSALPGVMETAIDSANLVEDGFQDRKMLFEIAGLFPEKGGLQVSINQNFQGLMEKGAGHGSTSESDDLLHEDPWIDAEIVED